MSRLTRLSPSGTRIRFLGGFSAPATLAASTKLLQAQDTSPAPPEPNVLGPRPGYSPQLGSFVSMLTWMREANGILSATKDLKPADLDYLFDANANTIGALMLHLAATETYDQMNTFDGLKWGTWSDEVKKNGMPRWNWAIEVGTPSRDTIATITSALCMRCGKGLWSSFASAMTHGCWQSTRLGRGGLPTISANGSTSASTKPIPPDRWPGYGNAFPEQRLRPVEYSDGDIQSAAPACFRMSSVMFPPLTSSATRPETGLARYAAVAAAPAGSASTPSRK